MKSRFIFLIAILISYMGFAQQGINYKAVIKDNSGNLVVDTTINFSFRISNIFEDEDGNIFDTEVYIEFHETTTDGNGIAILNIGSGSSSSGNFSDLDWGNEGSYFLSVSVDIGNGYVSLGTTQFMTVPYALHAKNVTGIEVRDDGNGVGWGLIGHNNSFHADIGNMSIDLSTKSDPEVNIPNSLGAPGNYAFAVGNKAKASGNSSIALGFLTEASGNYSASIANGFSIGDGSVAIGGATSNGQSSVAVGLDSRAESFREIAIGGNNTIYSPLSSTEWHPEDRLFSIGNGQDSGNLSSALTILKNGTITAPSLDISEITDDKALITKEYLEENAATKIDDLEDGKSDANGSSLFIGKDAGLNDDGTDNSNVAYGYSALEKNSTENYLTAIGYEALTNNTEGSYITSVGYQSLYSNTTGNANNANGYHALYSNTEGGGNTATGYWALRSNTIGSYNTAFGFWALPSNTTGGNNTAIGQNTLLNNSTASGNTAIGAGSLTNNNGSGNTAIGYNSLNNNTTGFWNTANGFEALRDNTTGINNTANGSRSLISNTTGSHNTANGASALRDNTTGSSNTANGYDALGSNTTGYGNTANGSGALGLNTTGNNNTANGVQALDNNTIGSGNTANGRSALLKNTIGESNTANGFEALRDNTTGNNNTANGFEALSKNTTGSQNTGNGKSALFDNTTGEYNTAIGWRALSINTTGNFNTAIGIDALYTTTTGSGNIGIGSAAQVPNATASNQVRIGGTLITYAGIQVPWTVTSDKRWKDQIRQLPYGLKMINKLKPVDYIRKNNEHKTREIGFIAQDVEKMLNQLEYKDQGFLTKDDKGYISLRYNDFIPVLVKAIQEQQNIIEQKTNEVADLTTRLERLEAIVLNSGSNNNSMHKTLIESKKE